MKNFNYPIVYTPMPIVKNENVIAFISVKCYLIEEHKEYLPNGEYSLTYNVLYLYDQHGKKIFPLYKDEKCVNTVRCSRVFDTFAMCKNFVKNKNSKILYDLTKGKSLEEIDKIYEEKNIEFNRYSKLENILLHGEEKRENNKVLKRVKNDVDKKGRQ